MSKHEMTPANSILDPIAFMIAVYCRNEIATKQILRAIANAAGTSLTGREAKTIVSKTLNIMSQDAREWVRGLYENF
jgi:hypothetical protein